MDVGCSVGIDCGIGMDYIMGIDCGVGIDYSIRWTTVLE